MSESASAFFEKPPIYELPDHRFTQDDWVQWQPEGYEPAIALVTDLFPTSLRQDDPSYGALVVRIGGLVEQGTVFESEMTARTGEQYTPEAAQRLKQRFIDQLFGNKDS